jgi:hypothetical protein
VSRGLKPPNAKALGYQSGPISEAKATAGESALRGCVRPGRGQVRVTGQTSEIDIDPIQCAMRLRMNGAPGMD